MNLTSRSGVGSPSIFASRLSRFHSFQVSKIRQWKFQLPFLPSGHMLQMYQVIVSVDALWTPCSQGLVC
jgi:hypothetical protein